MSLVFWDTLLFVYLMELNPVHARQVRRLRGEMIRRGDQLCTSTVTVGEVLVGPYREGDEALAARYREMFRAPFVEVLTFDSKSADHYARIRADKSISRADAMQLACAAAAGVDLFLTNDHRLHRKIIPGIQFVGGLDVNVL